MNLFCKFGPVTVLFQNFPSYSSFPFWRWKLDPYKNKEENKPADIFVNYCEEAVTATGAPIWEDPSSHREIFLFEDGKTLWQQKDPVENNILLQIIVSDDFKTLTITKDNSQTVGMGIFESLTFLIFYAFIRQNVLTFHGTLIEENGRGLIVCADSGVGKTTHARLWRDYKNALIINGDKATCFEKEGTWYGFGTPWCGTSGENINRSVPIKAIVLLERGEENRISEANPMHLILHTVYPSWHQKLTEEMLAIFNIILEKIPVLKLTCTPNCDAVDVLFHALENLAL